MLLVGRPWGRLIARIHAKAEESSKWRAVRSRLIRVTRNTSRGGEARRLDLRHALGIPLRSSTPRTGLPS